MAIGGETRREALLRNLLSAGLDSSLAERALGAGFTLSSLRTAPRRILAKSFDAEEVETIHNAVQRAPITEDVVQLLIERCDWSCCMCWDIAQRRPIIIHHLEEHAKGGNDSYDNLVVLCLEHHGYAHSRWDNSRHPAPPELIRRLKREFEAALIQFKMGIRAAPGREGNGLDERSRIGVSESPASKSPIPSKDERTWLAALAARSARSEPVNTREVILELSDHLPRSFDPMGIDTYLCAGGNRITVFGRALINPKDRHVQQCNVVASAICDILVDDPSRATVTASEISMRTDLGEQDVADVLEALAGFSAGNCFHNSGTSYGVAGWATINIDEPTFSYYVRFDCIEKRLEEHLTSARRARQS